MIVNRLKLINFKNYSARELYFTNKIVLFHGPNGVGKTNLLDAIHMIAISKSYFNMPDKAIVKHEQNFYRIEASLNKKDNLKHDLIYKYKLGCKKEIIIDDVPISSPVLLMGKFPVVFVTPDDIKIVKEGSRERRDFVNRILCQTDQEYIKALMGYRHLLQQKDSLLKSSRDVDVIVMDSFNDRLVPLGKTIHNKRKTFAEEFQQRSLRIYDLISDAKEKVSITYQSQLEGRDFAILLDEFQREELQLRRTLVGTHKDDFIFEINGYPFKKYGSQGQIKSFLYALRIAEYEYLSEKTATKPLLLLDDLFEKLDSVRLSHLIELVAQDGFGQIFLSDTEVDRVVECFRSRGIQIEAILVS